MSNSFEISVRGYDEYANTFSHSPLIYSKYSLRFELEFNFNANGNVLTIIASVFC